MKKLLSLLLVAVMILGMAPVAAQSASAEAATPEFAKVSMTLGGILGVNFKVRSNNADMSGYNVRVTVGNDQTSQTVSEPSLEESSGLYVYTASLPAHRMPESLKVELVDKSGQVADSREAFTVGAYLDALKKIDPSTTDLASALENYGTYAAYYAAPTGTAPAVSVVDKVVQSDLDGYKSIVTVSNSNLGPSAALYLDDACDLRISFSKDAWKDSYKFYFDGVEKSLSPVTAADGTQKVAYTHSRILPQNWGRLYNLKVVDTASNAVIFDCSYGVMTYARIQLGKAQEIQTGLNGLMKAMYLYHIQAKNYNTDLPELLLSASSWADGTVESLTSDSITLKANSQIKGDYLKSLWEDGYTHLVFNYTSQSTSGQYVDGSGSDKYWDNLGTKSGTDIRIDLNEFHDGTQTTWYNLVFRDQNAGMTVSNVRAYKSPETLNWTKSNSNSYLAMEDGYYVLETHGSMYVLSPHDWLKKYCLDGTAVQNWLVYTDYIYQGGNSRSLLWGNSAVAKDIIAGSAAGGWTNLGMGTIAYSATQQFRLQLDASGTARFKIADIVADSNYTLSYVNENTVAFTNNLAERNLYLATTNELLAAGYTKLRVRMSGTLPEGVALWHGNGKFGTEGMESTPFNNGSADCVYDMTKLAGEYFRIMVSGTPHTTPITDMQVTIEPVEEGGTVGELYTVVHPAQSENYTFEGAYSVAEGADYTFTAAPKADNVLLTVKVNGEVVTPTSGSSYTVSAVDKDLYITVETRVLDVVEQLYLPSNWGNKGTMAADASSITLPNASTLSGSYFKKLWAEGYTHLRFTYTGNNASIAYIQSGANTYRYWERFNGVTEKVIRVDLSEYWDDNNGNGLDDEGSAWYDLQFIEASGQMVISDVKAYKSPETLEWTKRNSVGTAITNAYFAIEDGYYVLETRETRANVTSPAQWLNKYRVADDAGQRSWLVYTDYLSAGNNADSPYFGWDGKITHFFKSGTAAGWTLFNARNDQTPYGETIKLGDATGFTFFLDQAGTARIKISDFVSNRNSENAALKLEYVDDRTVIWSGDSGYVLRYAPTQELKAAGYTHLRVTLTGEIPSGANFWYGNTTQNGVGPEKFTGGTYTFEEPLDNDYSAGQSFYMSVVEGSFTNLKIHIEPIKICTVTAPEGEGFTFAGDAVASEGQPYTFTVTPKEGYKVTQVTVNGSPVTGANNTYTVENVTGSLTVAVTAEPITYTVTKPTGDGFTVSGNGTASYGQPYTFTVEHPDYVLVTVKVNGNTVTGSGNSYTVENVKENLTITVEATQLDVVEQLLLPSAWNVDATANTAESITLNGYARLKGDYMQRLWDEGYTHLVFTVNTTSGGSNNLTNGSSNPERYWRGVTPGTNQTLRIDLNEFHDDNTWYDLVFSNGGMTVADVKAYKSAETLQWTKHASGGATNPSNIYFAIEDGYYVYQTTSGGYSIASPTEWLAKYSVDAIANKTWLMYYDYIEGTPRLIWGNGSAIDGVGTANQWNIKGGMWSAGYTEGDVFSFHTEGNGTMRIKLFDTVARYNNGTMTYISDNSYTFTTTQNEQKYYLTTTDELIAQGYTHLKVTFQGDPGSNTIWYGNDWQGMAVGIGRNELTEANNYTKTVEVDLSQMAGHPFTVQAQVLSGSLTTQVTVEPIGKADVPVKLVSGTGYSLEGAPFAQAGQAYSFKLPTDGDVTLNTVTVNNQVIKPAGDVYTVPAESVKDRLIIRVTGLTIQNGIVTPDEAIYGETADLLQAELAAAGKSMTVYNKNASNVTWENSILLGTQTSKEASVSAESYTVQGDGTNILVDGSCDRAVTYGVADLLRSLGYEFYTADVTVRPASVSLNYQISLADSADFAGRSYMSDDTSYNENDLKKQGFTAFSKQNNGLVANFDNFGGVKYYDFGGGVHNFDKFFESNLSYGSMVSTGVGSNTGYAPCLTSDATLNFAVSKMKQAILDNPDAYYFTFCQNDGPTWYCNCNRCEASASSYNRSGTLVNFINRMLEALAADSDLSGRDYRIVTFAYDFTAVAPKNVSSLNSKLLVWYAHWHNANYSINSSSQDYAPVVNEETRNYKTNLQAWAELTADDNLALWLYDANFNNYLALFPSINTIAQNIKDAQALGVSNILVQSGYEGEGNWQAELKAYIWSKLLWDSSLDVTALQNDFLKAYFGEAAYSSVQSFMNTYSSAIKSGAASSGFAVTSGNGYYCHYKNISSKTFSTALDYAQAAVSAAQTDAQKARANALLATVYGSVLAAWDDYKGWSTGWFPSDRNNDFTTDFGSSVSACQQKLREAIAAAGITHLAEATTDIEGWISVVTNRGY